MNLKREAPLNHFNDAANTWDTEQRIKMFKKFASKTEEYLDKNKKYKMLDFGCGTGAFGLELLDYASELIGLDTSEGMLAAFDKKIKSLDHVSTKLLNLEKEDINESFDIIISSMAFHHLINPLKMIHKMKKILNPEGMLIVIDLEEEDGTFHPNNDDMRVKHHGFSQEELYEWASSADLQLEIQRINTIHKNDREYIQFLAVFKKVK